MSFHITTDEGPTWEVIHDEQLRARQPHQCNVCGGPIRAGESYRRVAGKLDGEFQVHKEHSGATCYLYEKEATDAPGVG